MIVLILLLATELVADTRLRGGCPAKETEAPWVVYIRKCACQSWGRMSYQKFSSIIVNHNNTK